MVRGFALVLIIGVLSDVQRRIVTRTILRMVVRTEGRRLELYHVEVLTHVRHRRQAELVLPSAR